MGYTSHKYKIVSVEEMNERLRWCKDNRLIILGEKDTVFRHNAFVTVKMTKFELSYRDEFGTACTYISFLDERESKQVITGRTAFVTLSHYFKVPRDFQSLNKKISASPVLWKNDEYEGMRFMAISYDMNSSYSWAMMQPQPDARAECARFCSYVEEGKEVGFDENGKRISSGYAYIKFPLVESPFKEFINKWYNKKKTSKKGIERNKAKQVLNFAVGYLQNINPFYRANIIGLANERILQFKDENTVYLNTDSIVSIKRRDDIPIGSELGEFKVEHRGNFAFKKFNYQWNLQIPSYRGTPKSWFRPGWDILKDDLPQSGGVYRFNKNTIQLEEIAYGKEIEKMEGKSGEQDSR